MYYEYLIEKFIPWSLKIETKSTINSIIKEKEKYLCEMFNHFASSFKGIPTFELHMFRISFGTINLLSSELISISLPNHSKYHSVYIVYNDTKCNYLLLNKTSSKFELVDIDEKVVCGLIDLDFNNLQNVIMNYLSSK